MIKHKDHFHGSDLEAIEKCYHIKKEDIISVQMSIRWEFLISYVPHWPIIWMQLLRILTGSIQLFAPVLPRMRERSRKM